MPRWSNDELSRIGTAGELKIATARSDGALRSFVPVWVVRVGDDLFVRAYRGRTGSWFRQAVHSGRGLVRAGGVERQVTFEEGDLAATELIDAAYRDKYGRGMYVDAMLAPAAVEATLNLVRAA